MSHEPVRPSPSPSPGPASPVLPPRRDVEALSLLSSDHHLARIADVLTEQYAGVFSHETVAACWSSPAPCSPPPRTSTITWPSWLNDSPESG